MGLDEKRSGEHDPETRYESHKERDEKLKALLAEDLPTYFELLMLTYEKKLMTFVRFNYDQSYAEDIVQETFINAYKALAKNSAEYIVSLNIRPWLYTITRNLAVNHCRRFIKFPSISTDVQEGQDLLEQTENGQTPSPEQAIEQQEIYQELSHCIHCLPENLRVPLVLHYISDLEYQEIAEVLQQPVNTVKSNGRRGLKKLQAMMMRRER